MTQPMINCNQKVQAEVCSVGTSVIYAKATAHFAVDLQCWSL